MTCPLVSRPLVSRRALNPALEILVTSARTGEGVGELAAWLSARCGREFGGK